MARVLIIEPPPFPDWKPGKNAVTIGGRRHPALNVTGERIYSYLQLTAAAVLREQGHEVHYRHCLASEITLDGLDREIPRLAPDLVALQPEHISLGASLELRRRIRDHHRIPVVFNGPFATALAERLCEHAGDLVLRGEWDLSLTALANHLTSPAGTPGLAWHDGRQVHLPPPSPLVRDLDRLPFPAFDLVDLRRFRETAFSRHPTATTISSRGCRQHCRFCAFPHTIFSHEFRAQSPARVLEEALFLRDRHGARGLRYDDDTFETDRKRALAIAELFRSRRLGIPWIAQCRPENLDPELCRAFVRGGCDLVLCGVESASDESLRRLGKNTTGAQITEGVRNARRAGLRILNCLMLGFHWETEGEVRATIAFACRLNADLAQFSTPIPLPGTPYYEEVRQLGYLEEPRWEELDSFSGHRLEFPHLTGERIAELLREAYRTYYLRPAWVVRFLSRAVRRPELFLQFGRLALAWFRRRKAGRR